MIDNKLVEISFYQGQGYRPLVDYGEWRVALLNSDEKYTPEAITEMQCHLETDEVFVLLEGSCVLFAASGGEYPEEIFAQPLRAGQIYNVKKGVWHTHTLEKNTKVLIVENKNTSFANSPFRPLDSRQRQCLIKLAKQVE